jgi:hypothetical protein
MIDSNQKTSLLIPYQLPEFIRDNPSYGNFVLFLQAYYEWLEQNNNLIDREKNILTYTDIDTTTNEFIDYFYNDFLSYFPKEILADKKKVAKIARELYQTKGTQASYKFLFRVLYNSNVDFFYTKDVVLRASSGNWYIPKNLNLLTSDANFLNTINYKAFGETTKAVATIQNVVQTGTGKTQLFISDIQRSFQSGEYIRIIDSNNQNVLFNGNPLRAQLVGQVTQINIDLNNEGLLYLPGDPVVVYGGLTSNTAHGATGVVTTTTKGSLKLINVINEGYGYTLNNTAINIVNGGGATAIPYSVDPNPAKVANVTYIPINTIGTIASNTTIKIGSSKYYFSNNINANANTSLANAFTFLNFTTYPISSVLLQAAGTGLSTPPTITATSYYPTDNVSVVGNLYNLGILAPIQILSAGVGYRANDRIIFSGGTGSGAAANVTSVGANGQILTVSYVASANNPYYPLGGQYYSPFALPTVTVNSANTSAYGASLIVPNILGDGATFSSTVDRVGAIQTITVTDTGTDYISAPQISLKVQDIQVSNVSTINLPSKGDLIYQGNNILTSTYVATVDSIKVLQPVTDPIKSMYSLRVFNYTTTPNYNLPLKIDSKKISLNVTNQYSSYNTSTRFSSTGLITYGDGSAIATATFLNGLNFGKGSYIDSVGQPSSFSVLQSDIYNNYTYELTLQKEISKYRNILVNLLHPNGLKYLGRYSIEQDSNFNLNSIQALYQAHSLAYYTGTGSSLVTMTSDFVNQSNNLVTFNYLAGADLATYVFPNTSTLRITTANNFVISGKVISLTNVFQSPIANLVQDLNTSSNTVDLMLTLTNFDLNQVANSTIATLDSNTWLTYANVAYVKATAGSKQINIASFTGSYNIVNNGNYSNPNQPLRDIVYSGDTIQIANNGTQTVANVDYNNNIIYVQTVLANSVNSLMTVRRTILTNNVEIFGPTGQQYSPELTTEDLRTLTTENGSLLLLG